MNDTSRKVAQRVADFYRAMTPLQVLEMIASLNRAARIIVESSLPPGLTREERRSGLPRRGRRGWLSLVPTRCTAASGCRRP
jgi:hypothetical protein